jgi:hypothetical protein
MRKPGCDKTLVIVSILTVLVSLLMLAYCWWYVILGWQR